MKKIVPFILICIGSTAYAQCHVDTIPLADNNGGTCYITNLDVDFTPISVSTYQSMGNSYQSFSSPYVILQQGGNHQFDIQGVNNSDYTIACWLDMNNNSIFEGSEQLFASANEVNPFFTWGVYIPLNTTADTLHMRIIKQENAFGWGWGNDDACFAPGTGEVEDYLAIVTCANYDMVSLYTPLNMCYDDSVLLDGFVNLGDITWYTGSPMSAIYTGNPFWLHLPPGTTDTLVYFRNTGPGCYSAQLDSALFTFLPSPIANILGPDTIQSCTAVTVNSQPQPYAFSWSTGDSTTSITMNYTYAGTLTLYVTDTSNGCTSIDNIMVTVAPDPPANYAYVSPGPGYCFNYEVALTYDSLIAPGTCTWYTYPANVLVGTGSYLNYILPDTGTYQFMACVNSICGVDTMIHTFNAYPGADYDIIYSPDGTQDSTGAYVMCYNNSGQLSFIISGLQGSVQDWIIGDTTAGFSMSWNGDTIITLPASLMTQGHVYFAYAILTDLNGCPDTSEIVYAKPANTINFNLSDTVYACSFPVTIGSQASINYAVYDILWSNGDTLAPLTVNAPGTFWIYTYDNVNGCTMYDTTVVVDGTIVAGPFHDTTVACNGDAYFDLNMGGYQPGDWYEYDASWNLMNTYSGSDYTAFSNPGNSWLIVKTITQSGCPIIDTTFIDFNVNFTFSLGADINSMITPVTLNGPTGYYSYYWLPSNTTSPSLQVYTSGTYYLTIENGFGCIYTDTITVNILPTVISSSNNSDDILVYPNPADENVTLQSTSNIFSANIYTMTGALAQSELGDGRKQVELNTSQLAEGCYLIEIVTENGTSRSRVVISR